MSSYASEWPAVEVDSAFKKYFEEFYYISDTPDAHDKYVQQFTSNATLTMASRTARGSDEILALRNGLWEKVQTRRHHPTKIFPFGPNGNEVMLYGTVEYVLKDGKKSGLEWAARGHLVKEGGEVKMDFYQVYMDTAAQTANAK